LKGAERKRRPRDCHFISNCPHIPRSVLSVGIARRCLSPSPTFAFVSHGRSSFYFSLLFSFLLYVSCSRSVKNVFLSYSRRGTARKHQSAAKLTGGEEPWSRKEERPERKGSESSISPSFVFWSVGAVHCKVSSTCDLFLF